MCNNNICNKVYSKGVKPTVKISTKESQEAITDKIKILGWQNILIRLNGKGFDPGV
jgi:hypothetical protein